MTIFHGDKTIPPLPHPKIRGIVTSVPKIDAYDKIVLRYPDDEKVHKAIDVRSFEGRFSTVHHQFRVFTGEDDETVAPLGVAQSTASQQDLVVVQGIRLAQPRQSTLELAQNVVRRLAQHLA